MRLILHTGGTIGMAPGPDGLEPAAGLVEAAVAGRARVLAFDPLLDSADLNFQHWNDLLDQIQEENGPVIVTHGTDTMTWTGAALSQALIGWPYPVILTGAMHPLGTGGDAEANLELALSADPGPGVWLAFAGKLLPAAGLVKSNSRANDAFRAVYQLPNTDQPYQPRRFADHRLGILTITPGMSPSLLSTALAALEGAVLRVFGAGTIPGSAALVEDIRAGVAAGTLMRAVSQCESGGLEPGAYAAGQALWDAGVANGGAQTPEAAMIHMWLELSARQSG